MAVRFSVALCSHNGSEFIGEQLASIASQVRPPDEVIIADDSSSDDTVAIAREFAVRSRVPVQIIERQSALGVAQNFADAIARCSGDWIVLSDQDDRWLPERLELLESTVATRADADAIFTDGLIIDASGRPSGRTLWQGFGFTSRQRARFERGHEFEQLLQRNVVTGAALAFRAIRVPAVLPIPAGWIHDHWIALVIAASGRVLPLASPGILYRQHANNQIGVASRAVGDRAAQARATPREQYERQRALMLCLRERLLQSRGATSASLAILDEKISHLERRARLSPSRLRRVPAILSEIVSGRYAKFSSGWYSAARDLLIH